MRGVAAVFVLIGILTGSSATLAATPPDTDPPTDTDTDDTDVVDTDDTDVVDTDDTDTVDTDDTDTVDTDTDGLDTSDTAFSGPTYTAGDLVGEKGGSACAAIVAFPVGLMPLLLLAFTGRRRRS